MSMYELEQLQLSQKERDLESNKPPFQQADAIDITVLVSPVSSSLSCYDQLLTFLIYGFAIETHGDIPRFTLWRGFVLS
jgi:hypothetical protein